MQVKRQSNRQVINLGAVIARGGQGEIHEVPSDASLVAKIYYPHKLKDIDSDKLQLMVANPPDDSVKKDHGCVSIVWPVDLLLSINGSEQIIGFLMPLLPVEQVPPIVRPIHDYYNPQTRREKNLDFNYRSLHRTARNFASAMSALHAKQYVIGDVNESNILVYDTAIVTLVDTDSFQVRDFQHGKVYRCRVGKPEYTPPELQRKTFADYDRTPEHDLFGLGVLIFQLLMEGTHPFAGVYQGTGDPPPTEKRILAGHFPHGTKTVPYRPAQIAVRFDVLHPTLRQLFVRCFEDGHNNPQARPDARTWVKALEEAAEKDLVSCRVNSEHRYGGHLRDCPWCERKKRLGLDAFPPRAGIQSNIPVQIPLWPANKPKPVSSPAPTTYATPVRPTPTPIYNPPPSPTLTATPTPSPILTRRQFIKVASFVGLGTATAGIIGGRYWMNQLSNAITVSQSNFGQYKTISEAIKNAKPGMRILVFPGVYNETVIIDKQIEIIGTRWLPEVVIESTTSNCIKMQTNDAVIRNITIRGRAKGSPAVDIPQGRLVLEECDITSESTSIAIYGSKTKPIIRKCKIHDGKGDGIWFSDSSQGTIEDCEIFSNTTAQVVIQKGSNPQILRCKIYEGKAAGIYVGENGKSTVKNCDIFGNTKECVIEKAGNPTIISCKIHDGKDVGFFVSENGKGTLEDCDIFGNYKSEVYIEKGGNPTILRCKIHDGKGAGIDVRENGKGVVDSCDIFGNTYAGVYTVQEGNPKIIRCKIHDGKDAGVASKENGKGFVEDSDIFRNEKPGVYISTEGNPTILRCKIRDGKIEGIFVLNKGKGIIENCDIFNNSGSGVEIENDGNPIITQCRINRNKRYGVSAYKSLGTVNNCDLTGNRMGHSRLRLSDVIGNDNKYD